MTGAPPFWRPLGEGSLYRYHAGAALYEKLRLDVDARARALRLRIRNLDDRPLTLRGLRLVRLPRVVRLVPEEAPDGLTRLILEHVPALASAREVPLPPLAPLPAL